MNLLLDTNVVLDVYLDRAPWNADSAALWKANDEGRVLCHITASAITDVFYVVRREAGKDRARQAIVNCLKAFEICPVDGALLRTAAALEGADFEDDVQIACAIANRVDAIIHYARQIRVQQGGTARTDALRVPAAFAN